MSLRLPLCWFALACLGRGQGVWERRADYPIAATEVSAAAIDDKVYAVCGLTSTASVPSLYIYDPRVDAWSQGASAPVPGGADHCNVAAAGGKLYLVGAIRIGSSFVDGAAHEYDPATNRWQSFGRMNQPRGASGVAAIGTKIYVAGGLAGGGSVATFDVFDTQTRQWSRLPDMPTARDHLTAQAVNGRFYAIAGRVGDVFTVNEEYDPETSSWRRRAPIPTARGGLGSGAIAGRIQVFGGEGPSGTPEGTYRQNEEYDPVADTWRSLAPMPTPRHGLYGATVGGRLFAPSGGERAGGFFSRVHEAFYLPPETPPQIDGAGNAASYADVLAPGALALLGGARLSHGEQIATRFPLPTQMNAIAVRVNDAPAPLIYVGPNQVSFHLPYTLTPGSVRVQVINAGSGSNTLALTLAETAPGIFTVDQSGTGQGAILVGGTGLLAGAGGRAARRNDVVEIYCTGLGRVVDPPAAGQPARGPVRTVENAIATIGGVNAEVLYSGLAPELAGVYQVNARVPATAAAGPAVAVTLRIGGRASNTVTIAVAE